MQADFPILEQVPQSKIRFKIGTAPKLEILKIEGGFPASGKYTKILPWHTNKKKHFDKKRRSIDRKVKTIIIFLKSILERLKTSRLRSLDQFTKNTERNVRKIIKWNEGTKFLHKMRPLRTWPDETHIPLKDIKYLR